jgi:CTP-dependent riboflavin kinase
MYQDLVDDTGRTVQRGYRECAARYDMIHEELRGLRRPFTVLDLGAASGYFSIRLTQDYGARCVAVDPTDHVRTARGLVAAVVQQAVTPEDVRRLGTFDVVLGLSVLHHMPYWRDMLAMLNRITRSALIVETPDSREVLKQAVARRDVPKIEDQLGAMGMELLGTAPSVWDSSIHRGLYVLRRRGLPTSGTVFSGSGQNGVHVGRTRDRLATMLGYTPFPGSLNLLTKYAFRLGAHAMEFVDDRGKGGRRGGDYQIWHATVAGYDGPAHIMRPGTRGHGRQVLEVWAPVNLRERLRLKDGSIVNVKVGA